MTTARTVKKLSESFATFERSYVTIETVCRESDAISADRAQSLMDAMRAAHRQLSTTLSEMERQQAQEALQR